MDCYVIQCSPKRRRTVGLDLEAFSITIMIRDSNARECNGFGFVMGHVHGVYATVICGFYVYLLSCIVERFKLVELNCNGPEIYAFLEAELTVQYFNVFAFVTDRIRRNLDIVVFRIFNIDAHCCDTSAHPVGSVTGNRRNGEVICLDARFRIRRGSHYYCTVRRIDSEIGIPGTRTCANRSNIVTAHDEVSETVINIHVVCLTRINQYDIGP